MKSFLKWYQVPHFTFKEQLLLGFWYSIRKDDPHLLEIFFPFSNCLSVCLDFHLYLNQNNIKHDIKISQQI